jgi:hypothetical protein
MAAALDARRRRWVRKCKARLRQSREELHNSRTSTLRFEHPHFVPLPLRCCCCCTQGTLPLRRRQEKSAAATEERATGHSHRERQTESRSDGAESVRIGTDTRVDDVGQIHPELALQGAVQVVSAGPLLLHKRAQRVRQRLDSGTPVGLTGRPYPAGSRRDPQAESIARQGELFLSRTQRYATTLHHTPIGSNHAHSASPVAA